MKASSDLMGREVCRDLRAIGFGHRRNLLSGSVLGLKLKIPFDTYGSLYDSVLRWTGLPRDYSFN